MKRILPFIFFLYGQLSFGQLDFKNSNVGRQIDVTDLEGHSLVKKYDPVIAGSPFINDNWVPANLTLSRGKEIGPLQIKLNLESNELYFLDSTGKALIAAEGLIKKVDCINYYTKDSVRYVFKTGYPSIGEQNENYFYQAYTEGRIELLAKRFKYVSSEKNDLTGEMSKSFVDGITVLYVYAYGMIQVFKPNKTFVATLWDEDKQELMNKYLSANKINLKSTSDLVKLFTYYDALK